jgi:ABC-type multidrug transport system ATPase subunit
MAALVRLTSVSKSFGAVQALKGVSFEWQSGEVHALVGENGAGKSTLVKIITGAHRADSGTVEIAGQVVRHNDPAVAKALGVATIYQQPALFADLSVAENIALRLERGGLVRLVRWGRRRERAAELLDRVGACISPDTFVRDLSMPQQPLVEIASALGAEARILIFDKPTSSLSEREVENLFRVIGELRRQGVGSVCISHRLEELPRIADRVTVLRDGGYVATRPMDEVDRAELIRQMVGRSVDAVFSKVNVPLGEVVLETRGISCAQAKVHDVSLSIRAGEILGLAGLVGAGRTELARVLSGLTPADAGQILVRGRPVTIGSPDHAIRQGIAYVPEDRQRARQQRGMARYLLQGLLECGGCGYAYYRCGGMEGYRFGGTPVCSNKPVRLDRLGAAVWADVCAVLQNPGDLRREFERRLKGEDAQDVNLTQTHEQIAATERSIRRLIDAYEEGLLEKGELDPRLRQARERLERLRQEATKATDYAAQQADLRLVLGHLDQFAEQVRQGLDKADWNMRREIIRSLVKVVKIEDQHVRIIYRVSPRPFVEGRSSGPIRQHCHIRVFRHHQGDSREGPQGPLPPRRGQGNEGWQGGCGGPPTSARRSRPGPPRPCRSHRRRRLPSPRALGSSPRPRTAPSPATGWTREIDAPRNVGYIGAGYRVLAPPPAAVLLRPLQALKRPGIMASGSVPAAWVGRFSEGDVMTGNDRSCQGHIGSGCKGNEVRTLEGVLH